MRLFQSSIILLFVLLLSACVQFPINNFEVTSCSFSKTDVVVKDEKTSDFQTKLLENMSLLIKKWFLLLIVE